MAVLQAQEYEKNPLYLKPNEDIPTYNARVAPIIGAKPVTTLASSNVQDKYKPEAQNRLNKLIGTQRPYKDGTGAWMNPDGTPMAAPEGSSYSEGGGFYKSGEDIYRASPSADGQDYDTQINDLFATMNRSLDEGTKRQIDSIKQQYEARKAQLKDIDMRQGEGIAQTLLMGGSSRYAQQSSQGIVSEHERNSVMRLGELDSEEQAAIGAALAAQQSGKFQIMEQQLNIAERKRQEKQVEAEKLSKTIAEDNTKLRNQALIYNALQEGITDPLRIYGALGGDVSIEEVKGFLENVTPKAASGGFKITPAQTAQLMGVGLSGPQVDQAIQFVEQNGYPALAAVLTPEERKIFDMIFIPKDPRANAAGNGANVYGYDRAKQVLNALSVLPTQLRNADAEREFYEGIINQGLDEGLTSYQVADDLMGYQIENPDPFSEGMRKYMNLLPDTSSTNQIARLINAGDYDLAVSKLENQVLREQKAVDPEGYVGEATTAYYAEKVRQIKQTLDDAGFWNNVGPIEGVFQNALRQFRSKEASKIRSQVTSLVAEMRNHLAGTAVTDSERKFLEPLIPSLSDKTGAFRNKLSELESDSLMKHNRVRTAAELPPLTVEELLDKKLRVGLYSLRGDAVGAMQDPLELGSGGDESNPLGI